MTTSLLGSVLHEVARIQVPLRNEGILRNTMKAELMAEHVALRKALGEL